MLTALWDRASELDGIALVNETGFGFILPVL